MPPRCSGAAAFAVVMFPSLGGPTVDTLMILPTLLALPLAINPAGTAPWKTSKLAHLNQPVTPLHAVDGMQPETGSGR